MRKAFSLLSLAVLTVGLLGSCSKINERLDNLEKDVNGLKNEKIASIESQIAGITSSISDLGQIRSDISSLKQSAENHGIDIINLEEADRALKDRIDNLEDYLDVTLPKFAEKEWVEATFSTLEQYEATCDTIAKIDARIGALDAKLSKDIKATADSLTKWVNEQLDAYYTAAEMDAKLAQMKSAIDSAKASGGITDAKADSIARELAKTKTAVDTAKANIRKEYRAAIDTAIKTSEGKLTKALTDAIKTVNGKIESLVTRVDNLAAAVADLTGRVEKLEGMIQSVVIVPAYSDGSVEAKDGILYLDIIVEPSEAVAGLTRDSLKVLVHEANKAQTKAVKVDTISVADVKVDKDNGTVTARADISSKLPTADGKALTVALNVKNGLSDFTTEFVPVTVAAAKPIAEYVEIGGVKWATKNLGASTVGGSYSTCTGDYLQYGAETTLYNSITWDGSSATFNWKDGKSGGFTSGNGTYLSKAITDATDFVFNKAIRNGWRTPTKNDFISLINACGGTNGTATPNPLNSSDPEKGVYWLAADQDYLAEYKGVAGVLFVDGNKTKLFFPTTGYGKDTSLTDGTEGRYWTRDYTSGGFYCRLTSQEVNCGASTNRLRNCYGAPIRPVLKSTDIHLYPYVGASATLTATALPESAVTWTSSNVNVVSVSNDGVITVKGEGAATITASTADGRKDIFAVSVAPEPEYIEMAGIKWATKNLGATKIAGSYATCAGDFYQWGSIETLYESITWNGNSPQITWKSGKSAGYNDNNREYKETPETLPDDRDVVKMKIKDGWSMPTNDDFKALYKACGGNGDGEKPTSGGSIITNSKGIYYCENYYGVPGVLFCDGINTLFFPETGSLDGTTHQDESYSWTPSFYENRGGFDNAYCAHIDATRVSHKMYFACYRGFSIRPVKKIEK